MRKALYHVETFIAKKLFMIIKTEKKLRFISFGGPY